jgi:hypothetical protein
LCADPQGKRFALGTSYCDNLEFYTIRGNDASLARKYETYDVDGQYTEQGIQLNDNCLMAYKGTYGTEAFCYMLYSGECFGERQARSTGGKIILQFDWRGNHIETFEADRTIFSFCVDHQDRALYAITYDLDNGFLLSRFLLP